MSRSNFKVAIGPMSAEIVEATFKYSHQRGVPLALIATKNQIDYNRGYVEGWTTRTFMEAVKGFRGIYPHANVTICRDHCGPGFSGSQDLDDVYRTIEHDIWWGFDLIHIDFCKMDGGREAQIAMACDTIANMRKLKPDIRIEIGTDAIDGDQPSLPQIERELGQFLKVCRPEFYVINTGSQTLENRQIGDFNLHYVYGAELLLADYGIKLKEHNADFLTPEQIRERRGYVDAVNIAPELGVAQTRTTLNTISGDWFEFPEEHPRLATWTQKVYAGKKWGKWLLESTDALAPARLCIEAAGHYHFNEPEYQILRHAIGRENLIAVAEQIIDRYVTNLE